MAVKTIQEFVDAVSHIRSKDEYSNKHLLFRGQSNASWKILSTLERLGINEISLKDFYTDVDFYKPQINSLSSQKFERKIKYLSGYDFDFTTYNNISWNQFPELEYITFLRHHGFPTPLIDFSQSEYVALFFACEDAYKSSCNAKVFIVLEDFYCSAISGHPEVHNIGHYLETDKRHIAQQSEYLISLQYKCESPRMWYVVPFENAIKELDSEKNYIYEIEIDGSAKRNLLAELAKMNINHYTLYLDEDHLIEKLKMDYLRYYFENNR